MANHNFKLPGNRLENVLNPTGLSILDAVNGGNSQAGELYGIHSFTGGGATTLSCMIAAEGAVAEWKAAYPQSCKRRWCIVVTEQSKTEVMMYVYSYLAGVDFDEVQNSHKNIPAMPSEKLSHILDYVAQFGPGDELSRCVLAKTILDHCLVVVEDQSSSNSSLWSPATLLSDIISKAVGPLSDLAGLVVDGTGYFIDEYLKITKEPDKARPRLYREFLSGCRKMIAEPSSCPVWINHRLRSALAKSSPSELLTHKDLSECSRFSQYLDACFVLGNKDINGRFYLRCTKGPYDFTPAPSVVEFSPDGVRKIIENHDAIIESPSPKTWVSDSPVNIDDQTLKEIKQLKAEHVAKKFWFIKDEIHLSE
ncbi:hypothetical protein [uncultured Rubinisphaera sp.]|uniref:hypothetical protein n=1 Tax=uncultured Rubinisphaera sp. TaxID=1678686 RepID=UPI000EC74564|nr:hypothetical protein [Planctomycetaceae bacterium]|tara:strand:+ start:1550 stop:2647 length:1098 start_codon:yes stop_codon:yes gene_type:complete